MFEREIQANGRKVRRDPLRSTPIIIVVRDSGFARVRTPIPHGTSVPIPRKMRKKKRAAAFSSERWNPPPHASSWAATSARRSSVSRTSCPVKLYAAVQVKPPYATRSSAGRFAALACGVLLYASTSANVYCFAPPGVSPRPSVTSTRVVNLKMGRKPAGSRRSRRLLDNHGCSCK